MTRIDLGPFGAAIDPGEGGVDAAVELEAMGYSTIWLTGGPLRDLGQIAEVVSATRHVRIGTAIISVDRFGSDEVAELYRELESSQPGRFVVGLGGAHGLNPVATLDAYLDRLDEAQVPASARIMAALGPRMLDLARSRTSGALPVLITPEYTAQVRARLGEDTTLAVDQLVVVESDPERARSIALGPLGFLGRNPSYQASFRRMGFTEGEIAQLADRLVDAVVPGGDAETVAARIGEQLRAGADHVAVSVISDSRPRALDHWRQLADHLITP